jgi:hypothetical protein
MRRSFAVGSVVFFLLAVLPGAVPANAVTIPDDATIDLTLDPAPVVAVPGGTTITVVPGTTTSDSSAAPGSIQCDLKIAIHFRGVRNTQTGVVSGDWGYGSSIACNAPMDYLFTDARLTYQGSTWGNAPSDDCDTFLNDVCQVVASQGARSCGFCNGSWRGIGDFTVEFPAGSVVLDYDESRCDSPSPNTVVCSLRTSRVFL